MSDTLPASAPIAVPPAPDALTWDAALAARVLPRTREEFIAQVRDGQVDFTRLVLPGADLSTADLSGLTFTEANLAGCKFRGCDLRGCDFGGANLEAADFTASHLEKASFAHANLRLADLSLAYLGEVQAADAVFNQAILREVYARRAVFTRADLSYADLSGGDFEHADLECCFAFGVTIRGTQFRQANLNLSNWDDATAGFGLPTQTSEAALAAAPAAAP